MSQEAVLAERAEIDAEVEGKTIVDYLDRMRSVMATSPRSTPSTGTGRA